MARTALPISQVSPAAALLLQNPTPQAVPAIQRSQYLAQALQNLQDSAEKGIKSPGQLWSSLAASALLQEARTKTDRDMWGQVVQARQSQDANAASAMGLPAPNPGDYTLPTPKASLVDRGLGLMAHLLGGGSPQGAPVAQPTPPGAAPAPASGGSAPTGAPDILSQIANMPQLVVHGPDTPAAGAQDASAPAPVAAPAAAQNAALPRGLRNNNPLNLTTLANGQWNGQTGADGQYAQFATPQDGWTAADKNLQAYYSQHGLNTVAAVVKRWAPDAAPGYATTVAARLGVDPSAPLDLSNPNLRRGMLQAMAGVEQGQPVPYGQGAPAPASAAGAPGPAPVAAAQAQPPGSVQQPPPPAIAGGAQPIPTGPGPTPQELADYQRLIRSPYPEERAEALAIAQRVRQRQEEPLKAPDKMMWGPDGRVVPMPGAETQQLPGQTPSDAVQRDALGNVTHTAIPGMQGAVPPGMVWSSQAQRYVPAPTASKATFRIPGVLGTWANGPEGVPVKVADDAITPKDLQTSRDSWRSNDDVKKANEGIAAYNGLVSAIGKFADNNGVLSTAALDSYLRGINPGMGARNATVNMFLDHLGFSQELRSWIQSNIKGDGYLTPETLGQMVNTIRSYAGAHSQIAQGMADRDLKAMQSYGVPVTSEMLGEQLEPFADAPVAKWAGGLGTPAPAAAAPVDLSKPITPQQAAMLKPGTPFIGMDGVKRVRR